MNNITNSIYKDKYYKYKQKYFELKSKSKNYQIQKGGQRYNFIYEDMLGSEIFVENNNAFSIIVKNDFLYIGTADVFHPGNTQCIKIYVFSSDNFISEINFEPIITRISGCDVYNGFIYFLTPETPDIKVYDINGIYVGDIVFSERINIKVNLQISNDGLIYITEQDTHSIKVFNMDGELIKTIGSYGSGPGQFRFPHKLRFFNGNILVTDAFGLKMIDTDGNYISSYSRINLGSLTTYKDKIIVSSNLDKKLITLNSNLEFESIYGSLNEFSLVESLSVLENKLYISDYFKIKIYRIESINTEFSGFSGFSGLVEGNQVDPGIILPGNNVPLSQEQIYILTNYLTSFSGRPAPPLDLVQLMSMSSYSGNPSYSGYPGYQGYPSFSGNPSYYQNNRRFDIGTPQEIFDNITNYINNELNYSYSAPIILYYIENNRKV